MPSSSAPDDRLFAIFLSATGAALTPEVVAAHVAHLRALDDRGLLVLCGPFSDHPSGLVVVRADTKEVAEQIAAEDPFVVAGHRRAEVRTWTIAHRANGYLLDG